jgi:hypothetical protein
MEVCVIAKWLAGALVQVPSCPAVNVLSFTYYNQQKMWMEHNNKSLKNSVVFVINLPCPSLGVLIKLLSSRDIGRYNT